MEMTRRVTRIALLATVASLFYAGPAWAYLDPGTGSMMLQLLLGGIAGALVMGKLYWHRFREFVASRWSGKPRSVAHAMHAHASPRPERPDE
jgi:hypothetical protein